MRFWPSISLVVLTLAVGCAVNPATKKPQFVLTTEAQEQELGRRAAEEVDASMGTLKSGPIADYVSRVGQAVAAKAPAGQFEYEFRVVEMEEPNAFAVPGGYVFLSRGLLALTNTESELAGILAHEVGHVAARHGANQASVQAPLRVVTGLSAAATGIVSTSLGNAVSGLGGATTDALFASYGRDQEREADQLGQEFMAASGYDPAALSSALDSLHEHAVVEGQDDGPSFFSSHPSTPERVAATRERAITLAGPRDATKARRSAHLAKLAGLRIGPDPDHGVFVGSEFLQPAMEFKIRFPEGWEAVNALNFVAAKSKTALVMVSIAEGSDPMQIGRAIEQRDGVDLKLRSVRIGGLPAVRGEAKARMDRREGILDLAWVSHRGAVYQIVGASPVSSAGERESVLRAMDSFQPMTAGDRGRIRVERMRITTARAGETMAKVAARTGSKRSVAELEVMNGIASGERFAAGESVKIVRSERY